MGVLIGTGKMENLAAVIADPLTPEVVAMRIADGETLRELCDTWGLPYGQFARWLRADDGRWALFEGALAIWADAEAQSCIAIADEADPEEIPHAKLRIDTRMRLAEKWDRKRYGTKPEGGGSAGLTIVIQQLDGTRVPVEAASYAQPGVRSGEVCRAVPEDIAFIDKPDVADAEGA